MLEVLGGKDPVVVGGVVHSDDVEPLLGGDGVVPREPGGDGDGLGDRDRGPRQGDGRADACHHDRVPHVGNGHGASHVGHADRVFDAGQGQRCADAHGHGVYIYQLLGVHGLKISKSVVHELLENIFSTTDCLEKGNTGLLS